MQEVSLIPNSEPNGQTSTRGDFGSNGSAMSDNYILDDGKPESCATKFARTAFIDAIESLEEVRQMFDAHSTAIVGNHKLAILVGDADLRCACGIGNDIIDKIAEQTVQRTFRLIERRAYDDACWQINSSLDTFLLQLPSGVVEHIIDNTNKADEIVPFCIIGETDWQFVQSRELCHIEQQLGHARALRIASFEEMLALVVRHVGIGEYAFEIAMYAGSRSLELVSRILSELSLYSLLVFLAVTQFPEQRDDGVLDVA